MYGLGGQELFDQESSDDETDEENQDQEEDEKEAGEGGSRLSFDEPASQDVGPPPDGGPSRISYRHRFHWLAAQVRKEKKRRFITTV